MGELSQSSENKPEFHQVNPASVDLEARVKELELKDHAITDPMDVGDTYTDSQDDTELHDGAAALSAFAASSALAPPSAQSAQSTTFTPPAEATPIAASGPSDPAIPSIENTIQIHDLGFSNFHTNQSPQNSQYLNRNSLSTELNPHNTFDPLSSSIVTELCTAWFEKYHTWFPILHQPSLLEALQTSRTVQSCDRYLVIKAIVAVTIHHCQSCSSTLEERVQWSETIRNSVLVEATGKLSLQSIQSLLVLSNNEYGSGNMGRFWNFVALCKRFNPPLTLPHYPQPIWR